MCVLMIGYRSGKMLDTYELLNQEMCTWRLVSDLYKDRLETEQKAAQQPMMLDNLVCLIKTRYKIIIHTHWTVVILPFEPNESWEAH